jgi:hypothetical protein
LYFVCSSVGIFSTFYGIFSIMTNLFPIKLGNVWRQKPHLIYFYIVSDN